MEPSLQASYAGLTLSSPIVIGSSGLTNNVDKIKEFEKVGAGAVVLKSLFEEQIWMDTQSMLEYNNSAEATSYLQNYVQANNLKQYTDLISRSKSECRIPVIASINCYHADSWVSFAREIEKAGADALEVNIFKLATNPHEELGHYERLHVSILKRVKRETRLPIIIKMGQRFSNIVSQVTQLKANEAAGVVLFNRLYTPDIDIDTMQITSGSVFSSSEELGNTLRWVGVVSGQVPNFSIAASTGVHGVTDPIKLILAGASAVEVCSAVYQQGPEVVTRMNDAMREWMKKKGYRSISSFRGALNFQNIKDQSLYERVQFMKYFSNHQ